MEDFEKSVHLVEGINLKELMKEKCGEFSIDMNFMETNGKKSNLNIDEDLFLDDVDTSDEEDVLKVIEESAEKKLLSSPEYHSFEQLATKMIDCHFDGSVKLLIIEEGDGPLVSPDAEVTVHYAVYYERCDIPFDTTLTRNQGRPIRIRMWEEELIAGLQVGLRFVKGPTARFHLLLQPSAAWGQRGILKRIIPEPVLFVVCLYNTIYVGSASSFNEISAVDQAKFETTMRKVKDIRTLTNDFFKRRKYKQAAHGYQQAITALTFCHPENETEANELIDLKVKMNVNLAVCYYKINKPQKILKVCNCIELLIDINKHCKAMFYLGRANELLGNIDLAISYYKKALKLEPKNKEIGQVLANCDKHTENATTYEKVMWRKAFNNAPVVEEEKIVFNVDEDFKNGVAAMCQDLAGTSDFVKFDLPKGLSRDEIICIKDLTSKFKCLHVLEDGEGKRKSVSIIKKVE